MKLAFFSKSKVSIPTKASSLTTFQLPRNDIQQSRLSSFMANVPSSICPISR